MNSEIQNAAFVSCDIIGHGRELEHSKQLQRVKSINEIVRKVCGKQLGKGIIWASGGDGGHVAFLEEKLGPKAVRLSVRLIRDFFKWSQEEKRKSEFELRLTAHLGPVSIVDGADDRKQLVGDGINFCGSLLTFGTPGAVVVSSAFKKFVDRGLGQRDKLVNGTHFHDEQSVYLKHFVIHTLYFMSIDQEFESQRGFPDKSDYIQLSEACDKGVDWHIIYHAKRLLQVDSSNEKAREAIKHINPKSLMIKGSRGGESEAHPLFSQMTRKALERFIHHAHLVEREDGEVICELGDSGDTMFIVLKGQVGVVITRYSSLKNKEGLKVAYGLRLCEGEILGEIALALRRKRTATLQAIGPTAFLAVNYNGWCDLLSKKPKLIRLERSFENFLMSRILEHLCHKTIYLSNQRGGPLVDLEDPWEELVDDSERIVFPWQEIDEISPNQNPFDQPGLYILTNGRLVESLQLKGAWKTLNGDEFPIIFADLPNDLVSVQHKYRINPDEPSDNITIIRISDSAFREYGGNLKTYMNLVKAVSRQLSSQFLFDVFISYAHGDEKIAEFWRKKMQGANLKVYISSKESIKAKKFKDEIEVAIADSLVMMPLISSNALVSGPKESWVETEIRHRMKQFEGGNDNILPIELTPKIIEKVKLLDGYSAIRISGGDQPAIDEAIEEIRLYKTGDKPPPFTRHRVYRQAIDREKLYVRKIGDPICEMPYKDGSE